MLLGAKREKPPVDSVAGVHEKGRPVARSSPPKLILAEPVVQQFIITATDELKGISNFLMKEVENAHAIKQEQNNILANILLLGFCGFGIAWVTNKSIGLWTKKEDKNNRSYQ